MRFLLCALVRGDQDADWHQGENAFGCILCWALSGAFGSPRALSIPAHAAGQCSHVKATIVYSFAVVPQADGLVVATHGAYFYGVVVDLLIGL